MPPCARGVGRLVLACGNGAALSRFAAAAHWGFMRWEERCVPGALEANGFRVCA